MQPIIRHTNLKKPNQLQHKWVHILASTSYLQDSKQLHI